MNDQKCLLSLPRWRDFLFFHSHGTVVSILTVQSHLKERGIRLVDLFGRMVIWAKEASEDDLAHSAEGVTYATIARHAHCNRL